MAKGNVHSSERMRNVYFKSRTFVLVGLLVFGFAAFSFWGLSTQNSDLMSKIEQLEDNVNIGSGKLRDLEDELAASHKKYTELQKQNAKLQSDLTKKESLIDAQGGEAAQWRDRLRDTESEVTNLRTQIQSKTKELESLHQQLSSQSQEMALKDTQIREANEAITKLKSQIGFPNITSSNKLSNEAHVNESSSSSSVQPGLVLAKPSANSEEERKVPERYKIEPEAGAEVKAEEDDPVVIKPEEEMELVAPQSKDNNVIDAPDNDEAKFKEIRNEIEVPDDPVEKKDGSSKEVGGIKEPNLLNSNGENLDEEPALVDAAAPPRNPRFHNFNPRGNKEPEDNLPEDQEIENEHEDDRRGEN